MADEAEIAARRMFAEMSHKERELAAQHGHQAEASAVRYLVVVNGGAIIALLAFLSNIVGKGDQKAAALVADRLGAPFMIFATGLFFAALSSWLSGVLWKYILETQWTPAELKHHLETGGGGNVRSACVIRMIPHMNRVAHAIRLLALFCFIVGAWFSLGAIQSR